MRICSNISNFANGIYNGSMSDSEQRGFAVFESVRVTCDDGYDADAETFTSQVSLAGEANWFPSKPFWYSKPTIST